MSKQQRLKIRVSRLATTKVAKNSTVPTYHCKQDTRTEAPAEFLPIEDARELARVKKGQFINRGKAFMRFDKHADHDTTKYKRSGRRGESLKIDEDMMIAYVNGNEYAIEAVNSWA